MIIGICSVPNSAFSQRTQCYFGLPQNTELTQQLELAKKNSLVTQEIFKSFEVEGFENTPEICRKALPPALLPNQKNLKYLVQVADSTGYLKQKVFNQECLRQSVSFTVDSSEVICPSGKRTKDICVTDEILDYQNAIITNFYSCFEELGISTISPGALLSIFSLEAGFKPFYSSRNGVGLGQLTNDFVDDVHQAWRGGEYLARIAESTSKKCAAAKIVAEKDMKKKPHLKKICQFIEIGEGLERNILYALIGAATVWNKDLFSMMKKYRDKYESSAQFEKIKDLLLISAHGPGGKSSAIDLFGKISNRSPEQILTKGSGSESSQMLERNVDPYVKNVKNRQRLMLDNLSGILTTEELEKGIYSCVNK